MFKGRKDKDGNFIVTGIPGDGIGPEIFEAVKDIYKAAKVPIVFEEVSVAPTMVDGVSTIPKASLDSIHRNTVALKGALAAVPSALKVQARWRRPSARATSRST